MVSIVKVDQIKSSDGTTEYLNAGNIKNATLDSSVTNNSGVSSGAISSNAIFPAGMIINTTYGTYSTETQLSSTGTYVDALSVTATRKQSSSTMMIRGVLPTYWYTGGSSMYITVRLYRKTATAAQLGYFYMHRQNNTNTGHAETVTIDGFDTSPELSTEYCIQMSSSTHDSYPFFCYQGSTASLIVQEIAG